MEKVLGLVGNVAGVVGVVVCAVAGGVRLAGNYHLLGYESQTLFLAGTALMVLACLAKLQQLTGRRLP